MLKETNDLTIDSETLDILEKGISSIKHFNNLSKAYSNGKYNRKKDLEDISINNIENEINDTEIIEESKNSTSKLYSEYEKLPQINRVCNSDNGYINHPIYESNDDDYQELSIKLNNESR